MSARLVVSFVLAAAVASAQADRTFNGRVVDASGVPVVGARVRLDPRPLRRTAPWQEPALYPLRIAEAATPPKFFATTDVEGVFRFAVDGPEAPTACDFVVDGGPDYAPATYERARVGGPEAVVRLDAGGALTGVVTGDAGAPLAGAKVEIRLMAGGGMLDASATTGRDGAYRIERLPVGPHTQGAVVATFRVSCDGYATTLRRPTEPPVWSGAARAYRQDFALTRGVYVDGAVVDAATGAPRAGVRTIAWDTPDWLTRLGAFEDPDVAYTSALRDSRIVAETVSGPGGAFRLGPLDRWTDGSAPPRFHGGFAALAAEGSFAAARIERVGVDDGPAPVRLSLLDAVIVRGVVRDPDGRPAAGVHLSSELGGIDDYDRFSQFLALSALDEAGFLRRADSDADGSLSLAVVPVAEKGRRIAKLFAWRTGGDESSVETEVSPDMRAIAVDVQLAPAPPTPRSTIVGTVVDRLGATIPGVCVAAASDRRSVGDREPGSFGYADYCDAVGRFALPRRWPDDGKAAELRASARGFATSRRVADPSAPVAWTLEPGRRVSGVARWDDGAPAAGTRVFAEFAFAGYAADAWHDVRSEPDRWIAAAVVGDDGTFALDDLPAGDVAFFVAAPPVPTLYPPRPAGVVRRELGSVSADPGPDGTVALRLFAVPEPAGPAKPAWDWRPSAMMLFAGLLISLAARRESARRQAAQRAA